MKPIIKAIDTGRSGLLLAQFIRENCPVDKTDVNNMIRKGLVSVNHETIKDVTFKLYPDFYKIDIAGELSFNLTII